jgi:hypothetical protein
VAKFSENFYNYLLPGRAVKHKELKAVGEWFELFNFSYCRRHWNIVAHSLAKYGSQDDDDCVG